jgi:hypothetical protein
MNCPTCDGVIPDDCWTAAPPLPAPRSGRAPERGRISPGSATGRAGDGGSTDPHSSDHELTLWCDFCQMVAVAKVRIRRGTRQIVSVRSYANCRDVGRLLYRLPNARVRFVTRRRSRRTLDADSRLDHVGPGDARLPGDGRRAPGQPSSDAAAPVIASPIPSLAVGADPRPRLDAERNSQSSGSRPPSGAGPKDRTSPRRRGVG